VLRLNGNGKAQHVSFGETLGLAMELDNQPTRDWQAPQSGWARALERMALAVEKPVNRLIRSRQLNPFYHTGTIAVFLLIIIGLTGVYLFLFYQYGISVSYRAVSRIEGLFIARTMRAIHRYASGAAVITTLLHAWRTLFKEQFRGPRWLAWVTGVALTAVVWLAGVTGYWLVWDERAQLITEGVMAWLRNPTAVSTLITTARGTSWPLALLLLGIHVLLFLIAAGFFWLHVLRLNRAKWMPALPWVTGMGLLLLLGGMIFPVGMLAPADFNWLPQRVTIDPLFLFYLPARGDTAVLLWAGLLGVTAVLTALPWLSKGKRPHLPRVYVLDDRCTGCTRCALDCPYDALEMVKRPEGEPHKYLAVARPDLCVSCGICIGSCEDDAISLGETPPERLWQHVSTQLALAQAKTKRAAKVVFTCERHAGHGARPFLADDVPVIVIPVPCVGAVPPHLLARALDAGAAEAQIIGCPADDCNNREGNVWEAQRLMRRRAPHLKRAYVDAAITAVWVAPNEFADALQTESPADEAGRPDYRAGRRIDPLFTWQNLLAAFGLLAVALLAQIFLTDLPFTAHAADTAVLQLLLPDPAVPMGKQLALDAPAQLRLDVDGGTVFMQAYDPAGDSAPIHTAVSLPPGSHTARLEIIGRQSVVLFDETISLAPRQVYWLGVERELRKRAGTGSG